MPRKIWTGSINFGLVTIPVGLYSATEDHTIQFHQYQRGTADRVRYRRVNERTGKDVDYDDIVKGREVDGMLVTVEPKELEEIAPGRSRTIDITSFVDLDEIDPIFFQKTYWLAPNSKEQGRPYHLLRRAMNDAKRVGIATFVLRGKEYLTAVRAEDEVLALDTLFFADEIRDPAELVSESVATASPSDRELRMAADVIESMSGPWEPEEYQDTYTARVEQLIQDKAEGRETVSAQPPPQPTDVIDLTDALRRSVDHARRTRGEAGARKDRAKPAKDLTGLSKSELDKRAKELEIRGRSRMSRDELEAAVGQAKAASGRGRLRKKVS
jgi:DNA end-binding protein Ku